MVRTHETPKHVLLLKACLIKFLNKQLQVRWYLISLRFYTKQSIWSWDFEIRISKFIEEGEVTDNSTFANKRCMQFSAVFSNRRAGFDENRDDKTIQTESKYREKIDDVRVREGSSLVDNEIGSRVRSTNDFFSPFP